jgi:hypothetical protein
MVGSSISAGDAHRNLYRLPLYLSDFDYVLNDMTFFVKATTLLVFVKPCSAVIWLFYM